MESVSHCLANNSGKLAVACAMIRASAFAVGLQGTSRPDATTCSDGSVGAMTYPPLVSACFKGNDKGKSPNGVEHMEKQLAVVETDVAHVKMDISDLKKSVSTTEFTLNAMDKHLAIVVERLDSIKNTLATTPTTEAVEKRIADARLAIILAVPAIIAAGAALYKGAALLFNWR